MIPAQVLTIIIGAQVDISFLHSSLSFVFYTDEVVTHFTYESSKLNINSLDDFLRRAKRQLRGYDSPQQISIFVPNYIKTRTVQTENANWTDISPGTNLTQPRKSK